MQLFKYKQLPYPVNLWSAVFQKEFDPKSLPEDWEDSLSYVFAAVCPELRKALLIHYFKENLTMKEIGRIYNIRSQSVRQYISLSISYMQRAKLRRVLEVGLEKSRSIGEDTPGNRAAFPIIQGEHDIFIQPISFLGLYGRSYNGLRRAGIDTIGDLIAHSQSELKEIRGLGIGSIKEIERCLISFGLALKNQPDGQT